MVGRWLGVYDDHHRLMVAIRITEKFSALGIRIGVNYVVYSMTH